MPDHFLKTGREESLTLFCSKCCLKENLKGLYIFKTILFIFLSINISKHYHDFRFFFDVNTGSCRGFSYSGCGGNYNRFPSVSVCKAVCVPYIKHEEDN